MARAAIKLSGTWQSPCVCCGRFPHERADLMAESGNSAWQGCKACWSLAVHRNQLDVVRALCRLADGQGPALSPEEILR